MRDEEDILEATLDYHLARGVDFVVATDNLSTDGTPDILERYRRAGVLHVIREPRDDYAQGRWVTRMARLAAETFGADWVINGDADEFWWPAHGSLKTCLAAVPPHYGVVEAPRNNFVADPSRTGPFHHRLVLRETASCNPLGEPLPPKVCHRGDPQVVVAQGNHVATGPDLGAVLDGAGLSVLHFPVRSFAQFENKIVLGGRAYARNAELPAAIGHVWRTLYHTQQAGRLREAYDRLAPDACALARGLAAGTLVVDTRLRQFLDDLPRDQAPPTVRPARSAGPA